MVIIGSDSHTPHAGAVGCVAFGVGTTAIFNSWITKDVRLTVPETVKVVVRGRKPDNVTAKDFMLEVLRHPYVKSGQTIGKLVEYSGDPGRGGKRKTWTCARGWSRRRRSGGRGSRRGCGSTSSAARRT